MVAGGLAIIYLLPRLTKVVPSPLVAIVVLSLLAIWLALPVNRVGDMGELLSSFPSFLFPNAPLTLETLQIILPFSLTMAAVGLLESLLTAQIVDDLTDKSTRRAAHGPRAACGTRHSRRRGHA